MAESKSMRIARVLRLITLMQRGERVGTQDLMDDLGVSRRTLFRDLKALDEAGIPYTYSPEHGYRIESNFFMPPINLTVTEMLGLMLLGKFATAQLDKPLVASALSGIYKLAATMPEPLRSACGEVMQSITVDPAAQVAGDRESAHHATLQRCIDERRPCRVDYESPVAEYSFKSRFEPYALHFSERAWYVLGRTELHDEVRMLKLTRLVNVLPTDGTFFRQENFHVSDKLGNAWRVNPEGWDYKVELLFSPKVATNVSEVRWHPTQEHELLSDGRCRMTFTVDGLNEIAWWVCGYAGEVEVRKPEQLRERVKELHAAALARYDK